MSDDRLIEVLVGAFGTLAMFVVARMWLRLESLEANLEHFKDDTAKFFVRRSETERMESRIIEAIRDLSKEHREHVANSTKLWIDHAEHK